jgi:hypothetical protein
MALAWKAGWVNALRGSNPLSSAVVMSQDIGIARTHGCGFGLIAFRRWAEWSSGAVVVTGRVDDQIAEDLAGGGVARPLILHFA